MPRLSQRASMYVPQSLQQVVVVSSESQGELSCFWHQGNNALIASCRHTGARGVDLGDRAVWVGRAACCRRLWAVRYRPMYVRHLVGRSHV
jgi:hypothetical protein